MRLFLYLTVAIAFSFVVVKEVTASSVEYLSNQSPEYIRSLNRNAATDAADVANYNPAGVMRMQDGLYLNAGGQYLFKKYTSENDTNTTLNPDTYESDVPSIIPNLYAVYKQEVWAAFFAFTIPAGGGKLEFDDGTPEVRAGIYQAVAGVMGAAAGFNAATNVDKLTLESIYYGYSLGGAYKINDMFSVSLGGRLITADKKITIDSKEDLGAPITDGTTFADIALETKGFGGIIGFNAAPIENLNIGMRYETVTKLKWDTSVDGSAIAVGLVEQLGYKDGETEKKDLPSLLAMGASYDIIPELKASTGFTYYFIKQAEWEHFDGTKTNKYYDNGYDIGISLEYKVLPQLLLSTGYLYSKIGSNDKTWSDFEIALDSNNIAFGVKYEAISGLNINLGFDWTMYKDSKNENNTAFTKDVKVIALGVEYKAL